MIDNRKKLNYAFTSKDERLAEISETEIVLELSKALTSIYPHLIKLYAHCYDPFDDIAEGLLFNFIYRTFEDKYGIPINYSETHRYGFSLNRLEPINHIRVKPKNYPISLIGSFGGSLSLEEKDLQNKLFVFTNFGDTVNNLTGGEEFVDVNSVNFNFTEIQIFEKSSRLRVMSQTSYWVRNSEVEYELVLEDYKS